jgi:hypothetical protein
MNAMSSALRRWLLGAAAAVVGCGGAAVEEVPGLPADFQGPGVYTVPAVPAASFAVSNVHVEQGGGTVSVYYDLPTDLVGGKQSVALTGPAGGTATVSLTGAAGTSTCTVSAGKMQCDEHLTGVHVDVAQALSELPPDDPRRAAVQAFSQDPIGVLAVTFSQGEGYDGGAGGSP